MPQTRLMLTSRLAHGVIIVSKLHEVLDELEGVRKLSPGQWEARCPAHDDNNPSLSVAEGDEQPVVLHCHKGCDFTEIAAELDNL